MSVNRFAHLKEPQATLEAEPEVPPAQPLDVSSTGSVPVPIPALPAAPPEPADELQELVHLVERRIGIVGKIPASLKDAYDEMLLRNRKYIERTNADLAVQAWVELTLEDDTLQRRWLKRMQDLRKQ